MKNIYLVENTNSNGSEVVAYFENIDKARNAMKVRAGWVQNLGECKIYEIENNKLGTEPLNVYEVNDEFLKRAANFKIKLIKKCYILTNTKNGKKEILGYFDSSFRILNLIKKKESWLGEKAGNMRIYEILVNKPNVKPRLVYREVGDNDPE